MDKLIIIGGKGTAINAGESIIDAAKNYLNTELFDNAGLHVHWLDYSNYPEYPQLFGGFQHGVSIIDLIFNTGPDAIKYMKSFNESK